MKEIIQLSVHPLEIQDVEKIKILALSTLNISKKDADNYTLKIEKRSLDARSKLPLYRLKVIISDDKQSVLDNLSRTKNYKDVSRANEVYIIGAGPAGYFAALECIDLGLKPIVIEQGKDVRSRRIDLRNIQQEGIVNPHSNYCFGEGGAGTYSDGKLYTRSHKRGNILKTLELLVEHGANPDILIDSHPHIGSNKLPNIISAIRETIEQYGGEVRFNTELTDIHQQCGKITGFTVNKNEHIPCRHLILATGHSARDIFSLLDRKNIEIQPKSFALGVRIEHPQSFIDVSQYGVDRNAYQLPASSYKLVSQIRGKGVFSFCMCPGGLVVPAATAPGEIVVNGMSLSRRDSPYANSGVVVEIGMEDFQQELTVDALKGVAYQQKVERAMFSVSDGTQMAPAQRVIDFVENKISQDLPECSYIPGLISAPVSEILPWHISMRLKDGIKQFNRKLRGYLSNDAVVIGVESRTSSPVRIPRDRKTLEHIRIHGLFPCGEGAGYAGGILSAAMDGQRVARAIFQNKKEEKC